LLPQIANLNLTMLHYRMLHSKNHNCFAGTYWILALHKWIGWCTEWIVIGWWFKPHPTAMPCCCHWSALEIHLPQPNKLAAADKLLLRRCPLRKKNKHVRWNQLTEPILLAHWTDDNIGGFRKLLTISARALGSWGSVSEFVDSWDAHSQ